jgi:hypothetical protein
VQSCDQNVTIGDIKRELSTLEDVEHAQIVLVHAGAPLADSAVPASDLANFNRSGEILLDLQVACHPLA